MKAIASRNYRQAWKALKAAAQEEPDNPLINDRLAKVDALLRRSL